MKFYEKMLYHAAAYSVIVTLLFFGFASIMGVDDLSVSFGRFALIVAFGLVLSTAEFIFVVKKIPKWGQYIIHFLILALAFFGVFLSVRTSTGEFEFSAATVFASLIIFTVVYFIGLGIVFAFRRTLSEDKKKKAPSKPQGNKDKKENYTPRFKNK